MRDEQRFGVEPSGRIGFHRGTLSAAIRIAHVRIEGRVQGVGYRAWVEATARSLRLKGWVRNRRDGSVEAVFQGPPDHVSDMLGRCEQGPPAARVAHIELLPENVGQYDDFDVWPTA